MGNELVKRDDNSRDVLADIAGQSGDIYIRYRMDKDNDFFYNNDTDEKKSELIVKIVNFNSERVNIKDGECLCASNDGKSSRDGVVCGTCPNVSYLFKKPSVQRDMYLMACQQANLKDPPMWNEATTCRGRLVLEWEEEFERNADGSYTWVKQPGKCVLSIGGSSIFNLAIDKDGYLKRLISKGYGNPKEDSRDILARVVTCIKIGQRRNEKLKSNYSYETFAFEGNYLDIVNKCGNKKEMVDAYGLDESKLKIETSQTTQKLPGTTAGQSTTPKPAEMPKKQENKGVVDVPNQPASTPKEPVKVTGTAETRLKIKFVYASIPTEVQKMILNVLKVNTIEDIPDSDLPMALETLEYAQEDVKKNTKPQPTGNVDGGKDKGKKGPW